jgi:hypothetical protein
MKPHTIIAPLACTIILASIPAQADATHRLWIKQARTVTTRMARAEIRADRDYPDHIAFTKPTCKRTSRTSATCEYTVVHHNGPDGSKPAGFGSCQRRVYVRLPAGSRHAVGSKANLDCYLKQPNGDSDYEA